MAVDVVVVLVVGIFLEIGEVMVVAIVAVVVVIAAVVVVVKFPEKHDKNHETDNKTHTHTPSIYTLMHPNVLK